MIPRIKIAHLPTPVEALPRLSAALGGPRLLVKRDDLTGLAGGGNKTRKLEYLLADAQSHGAKMLISTGAAQSNHCRQVAAVAARFGMGCTLVLSGDPASAANGNLLLDKLLGAEIVWCTREARSATLDRVFDEAWSAGKRPYKMPLGGSTPVGAMGYVTAFEELMAQAVQTDWVVFASSSAGTQAGLVLGARRAGWQGRLLGISVDEPQAHLQQMVAELASQTASWLDEKMNFNPEEILVNTDYLGAGYGVMDAPEIEAIQLFAQTEGLLLDPVYTGRAAAGMIDLVRKGFFKRDETVLFWHTGGLPAMFAEPYARRLENLE